MPHRLIHRPRLTLGQILASVAVSSLPIAVVMRAMSTDDSLEDLFSVGFFCFLLTLLAEFFFWGCVVPFFPSLERGLGRPSWFRREVVVDPMGINWVEEKPTPIGTSKPAEAGIRWVEEDRGAAGSRPCAS